MKKKDLYFGFMFVGVYLAFVLFAGCVSTSKVPEWALVINPGETVIKERAFYNRQFEVAIIPYGITTIGKEAFAKNKLFRVHIPETCTEIAPDAFDKGVILIYMKDRPGEYAGDYKIIENKTGVAITNYIGRNMSVVIPSEINGRQVTEIGQWAFAGKGLESVVIPDTVRSINELAFEYNFLKEVTIPEGITELPNQVFGHNILNSVTLPNSLTTIGQAAFRYNKLSTVTLPNSLTTIGEYAFWNNNLETVVIPDSVKTLGKNAIPSTLDYTPSKENGWNRYIKITKFDGSNVDWITGASGNMLQPNQVGRLRNLTPGKHTFVLNYSEGGFSVKDIPFEYEFKAGVYYDLDIIRGINMGDSRDLLQMSNYSSKDNQALDILVNGIRVRRISLVY